MPKIRFTAEVTANLQGMSTTRSNSQVVHQDGQGGIHHILNVPTAGIILSLASSMGYVQISNFDSTNYVTWGLNDGGTLRALGRVKAGTFAVFKAKTTLSVRMAANTADVLCEVLSVTK
jgi:hypothetical protein